MKSNRVLFHSVVVMAALLLLGALGVYWPAFVGADSPVGREALEAIVDDAITYQGYLTDDEGVPLDGTLPMRFIIYDASAGGNIMWDSGNLNVPVTNGLFDVKFDIAEDIFNGEELWLAQTVSGQTLTPRQELLPAPAAHTLRPGAVIKGTANAIPNNYAVEVHMNNDTFSFNRGAIAAQTTTGNGVFSQAFNGRALYGQTAEGYAVYGFDGGNLSNRGYAGYFYSTNGIGVYGYSGADRSHPNIYAPGVYGQSNQGIGVYGRGDTSDSHSFYNQGGRFEGGTGLFARGSDPPGEQGYGAQIYSDNYRGMYVEADNNWFDAYFGGDTGISTFGIIDRSAMNAVLAINLGATDIAPGDLVALAGVGTSPEHGKPMLGVARVDGTNAAAVIGVAREAVAATPTLREDGSTYLDLGPMAGSAGPEGYVVVITSGLAPAVNVSDLAGLDGVTIGARVMVAVNGALAPAADGGVVVGKVAGPLDAATGTIPLFVDID